MIFGPLPSATTSALTVAPATTGLPTTTLSSLDTTNTLSKVTVSPAATFNFST